VERAVSEMKHIKASEGAFSPFHSLTHSIIHSSD